MICAKANVSASVKFGSSLAYKNHAANNLLAAELFHAQTPAGRIAAVARRTACLFVSHNLRSENLLRLAQKGKADFDVPTSAFERAGELLVLPIRQRKPPSPSRTIRRRSGCPSRAQP